MIRKEAGGVQWLEFELLADCKKLKHGVFILNACTSDRAKIEKIMDCSLTRINMRHGKTVHVIDEFPYVETPVCDAITTGLGGLGLMITHADCQAAIFYDPVKHVVANAHSGWRGSVQNIYAEVVQTMKDRFGSNPKDFLVGVSPSLGPNRSEFINFEKELPWEFLKYQFKPTYFDFWQITNDQLRAAGIPEGHIQIASICTYDNPADFFSYRRDKTTGRNATVVSLF